VTTVSVEQAAGHDQGLAALPRPLGVPDIGGGGAVSSSQSAWSGRVVVAACWRAMIACMLTQMGYTEPTPNPNQLTVLLRTKSQARAGIQLSVPVEVGLSLDPGPLSSAACPVSPRRRPLACVAKAG
jgi:hypothetical protein